MGSDDADASAATSSAPVAPAPSTFVKRISYAFRGLAALSLLLWGALKIWYFAAAVAIFWLLAVGVYFTAEMRNFRFSLRTLLLIMIWGGTCGTLLQNPNRPALFSIGIVSSILLFAFLISSVVRANVPPERMDAD